MLDRTIARGNPNAQDVKALCSVIFRMNEYRAVGRANRIRRQKIRQGDTNDCNRRK